MTIGINQIPSNAQFHYGMKHDKTQFLWVLGGFGMVLSPYAVASLANGQVKSDHMAGAGECFAGCSIFDLGYKAQ